MTQITLLDGGMGQELVKRSGDTPSPLWATQVMIDHPGLVQGIHADFFAAGATIATTNTYAVLRDRLAPSGQEDKFEDLHKAALAEAKAAQAAHGSGRIAGSIGPLGASYRADIHPAYDEAVGLYGEIADLIAPDCDVILCETVVSVLHAQSVLEGAKRAGKPVWLAFTVDDEDGTFLRSGEPLRDVLSIAKDADGVLANCSGPEAMPAALDVLAQTGLPFGAYANGFTQITKDFLKTNPTVDSLSARRDMGPAIYADHVMNWVDQGATLVGGCCEISPAHIAEISRRLRAAGHTIV
ncbi:MAG: homocysteine S-methyltransferase family protein [Paracoccaceae bacterium]